MKALLAQSSVNLGNITGLGPYGTSVVSAGNATYLFVLLISSVIGMLTIIAGLYFLFQLIIAGYRWLSAGGEKQGAQEAQKRITNALTGIVLIVAAYALNGLVGYILGLETINIGDLIINNIHP